MNEAATIRPLSTSPDVIPNITTIKAIISKNVMGMTYVFTSSSLDAKEPVSRDARNITRNVTGYPLS